MKKEESPELINPHTGRPTKVIATNERGVYLEDLESTPHANEYSFVSWNEAEKLITSLKELNERTEKKSSNSGNKGEK